MNRYFLAVSALLSISYMHAYNQVEIEQAIRESDLTTVQQLAEQSPSLTEHDARHYHKLSHEISKQKLAARYELTGKSWGRIAGGAVTVLTGIGLVGLALSGEKPQGKDDKFIFLSIAGLGAALAGFGGRQLYKGITKYDAQDEAKHALAVQAYFNSHVSPTN